MASGKVDSARNTMSEEDEDNLVAAASVPSLAALVRAGKEKGLIQPITGYTATS